MIADHVITIAGLIGAASTICALIYGIIVWFQGQNRLKEDFASLKKKHDEDMEIASSREDEKLAPIKEELCLQSFVMLAVLDGLKQQGCNGKVTMAHDKLEKFLNERAHEQ